MFELLSSRYYRSKINILALLTYIVYHGSGLIYAIGIFSLKGGSFGDADEWLITSSIVIQTLGICMYIWMSFRILFTHYKHMNDIIWLNETRKILYVGSIIYFIGIILLFARLLEMNTNWDVVILSVFNKSFLFVMIGVIQFDLKIGPKRLRRIKYISTLSSVWLVPYCALYFFFMFVEWNRASAVLATILLNIGIWAIMITILPSSYINMCCDDTGSDGPGMN